MGILRKSRSKKAGSAGNGKLPRHIAIIMDGNGRWAKRRGLPRALGHEAGAEAFKRLTYYCRDIGIEYLTVYAFSTENWKRPSEEVAAIMKLLESYLLEAIEKMERDGIRLRIAGDLSQLSDRLRNLVSLTDEKSVRIEKGLIVNLCVNYGGRDEILHAARRYAEDFKSGSVNELTEDVFSGYTYIGAIPDPDLIIRPSGELRLSNFMLWQCAYSEFFFTEVLWPDFGPKELDEAIKAYQKRSRRFGDIDKQRIGGN